MTDPERTYSGDVHVICRCKTINKFLVSGTPPFVQPFRCSNCSNSWVVSVDLSEEGAAYMSINRGEYEDEIGAEAKRRMDGDSPVTPYDEARKGLGLSDD